MKNKIICIPIETKVREFDGKLLLATHLLNSDYKVLIGSRKGIIREIKYLNNAIYFGKNISKSQKSFYQDLKKKKNIIVSQDVEGGVLEKNEKSSLASSYPLDIIPMIDSIFLFGSKIKEALLKYDSEIDKTKVHCTGDLRFDLLQSKYRSFYDKEIKEIQDIYGRFILINTSFSLANPFVGISKLKEFYNNSIDFDDSKKEKLLFKQDYYRSILDDYIKSIEKLAIHFDNIKFIIRPHPSESLDIYKDRFKKFENIVINNSGNVHNWIYASLGVVHYDCTTGIESVLADKPTIAYVPQKNDKIFAWLPAYVSKEVGSTDALITNIGNIVNNNFDFNLSELQLKTLKQYIHNIDVLCVEELIKQLKQLSDNSNSSFNNNNINLSILRFKSIIANLRNKVLNRHKTSITMRKFGGIKIEEVINKIDRFKRIEDFSFDFKVKKIGADVVSVHRR